MSTNKLFVLIFYSRIDTVLLNLCPLMRRHQGTAENVGEAISLPFYMTTKMREDNILPYTMTEKRSGGSKPRPTL